MADRELSNTVKSEEPEKFEQFLTSKRHTRGAWGLAGGGEGLVVELQVLATTGSVLQA